MKQITIDMSVTHSYFIDRLNNLYNTMISTNYHDELKASRSRFLEAVKIGIDLGILSSDDLKDYDDNVLFKEILSASKGE